MSKLVDKLKEWVFDKGEDKDNLNWGAALGVAIVAVITVALMYFRLWNQGRKLAKLLHEKDVMDQSAKRKKVLDFVSKNQDEAALRVAEVVYAEARLKELELELEEIQNAKTKTEVEIKALESWDDVDRYLSDDDNTR